MVGSHVKVTQLRNLASGWEDGTAVCARVCKKMTVVRLSKVTGVFVASWREGIENSKP